MPIKEKPQDFCEVVHIGIVCTGYKSSLLFHNLLKSILFHRVNPIHFHVITDRSTENVLNTLMNSWALPQVNYTFYDMVEFVDDVKWVPNSHYSGIFGMLKLVFPKIVPLSVTDRILILDTDLTVVEDIYELWRHFENFGESQAIGIVENESDFYLTGDVWPALKKGFNSGVLLYNIEKLKRTNWMKLWSDVTKKNALIHGSAKLADQDVINAVFVEHPELVYEVPCYWNTQLSDRTKSKSCYSANKVKIIHWNSPKKYYVKNRDRDYFFSLATIYMEYNGNLLRKQILKCDTEIKIYAPEIDNVCDEFRRASEGKWRTLLFFMNYKYKKERSDITFVAQLSFERLYIIEEIANYWSGPMSFTFYLTDAELIKTVSFIKNSDVLSERANIAYHVVFKDGNYYPINILRNIGLKNVNTPFVFLADVDFVPVPRLCETLRYFLKNKELKKEALIIPAFELTYFTDSAPRNKSRLIQMWENGRVVPFLERIWPEGHSPTNFKNWKIAEKPYQVKWVQNFEPYVVVRSDVVRYDERFVGFGWNKVSHIMELEAADYVFTVLPDVFIVHKPHSPSSDMTSFRTSLQYRQCLHLLKEEFIQTLNRNYSKHFELYNGTITFPSAKRRKRNFDTIPTTEETNTDYPYIL